MAAADGRDRMDASDSLRLKTRKLVSWTWLLFLAVTFFFLEFSILQLSTS